MAVELLMAQQILVAVVAVQVAQVVLVSLFLDIHLIM